LLTVACTQDLGEGVGITEEDMDMAQVGELADYGATKKKLEDEIKKIEDGLAKKKVLPAFFSTLLHQAT
jgi:hypothetical protein